MMPVRCEGVCGAVYVNVTFVGLSVTNLEKSMNHYHKPGASFLCLKGWSAAE